MLASLPHIHNNGERLPEKEQDVVLHEMGALSSYPAKRHTDLAFILFGYSDGSHYGQYLRI
ncbi:hypothetical protein D3C73_1466240 [compost metagenome]